MAGVPKLIILSEQFRGRTFELTKDQHSVGRVDERDICIKDPTISTYHCRFIRDGNTYIVEDQGSTNGTRVNNVPIMSQTLQNSDIIQVGGVEILYDCDDKSSATSTVQMTNTGIEFSRPSSSTQTIKAITEMGFQKKNRSNGSQHFMIGIIIILALLVIGLLGFLIFSMQKAEKINTQTVPAAIAIPEAPVPPAATEATAPAAPAVPVVPAAPAAAMPETAAAPAL